MKERRAQEGKGSGHSRVGEEQTVPPSNPLWSSWLPGTIPHWGPLSGFEWEGRREGFGFPPLSPQGQWRMGRRALVTHRLASSWTLGLETDGSVNSQGIPRSSSWVQELQQNQGKAQAAQATPTDWAHTEKAQGHGKDTSAEQEQEAMEEAKAGSTLCTDIDGWDRENTVNPDLNQTQETYSV